MFVEEVVRATGVYVATFAFVWLSAMVPFVNVELFMLGIAPTVSEALLIPIVLPTAAGQMTGKVSALRRIFASQPRLSDPLIFASALTGLPTFYAVSIAAGGLRLSLRRFVAAGFVGREIRFGALALTAQSVVGVLL